jgi:hypothetical protein
MQVPEPDRGHKEIRVIVIKNVNFDMSAIVVRAEDEGLVRDVIEDAEKHFCRTLDVDSEAADILKKAVTHVRPFTSAEWRDQVCCQMMSSEWRRLRDGDAGEEIGEVFQTRMPLLIVLPNYMAFHDYDFDGRSWRSYARRGERRYREQHPGVIRGWRCQPCFAWMENMSEGERAELEGRELEESSEEEEETTEEVTGE